MLDEVATSYYAAGTGLGNSLGSIREWKVSMNKVQVNVKSSRDVYCLAR